jgi:catechol 2,3-dioxygenase-like lactoylglutathione lyase family enzyme
MQLCQVASSVTDLRRTHAWYRDVLGFQEAGGTNTFVGPVASMVQGLPRAASVCWWLVDRQDFFQLELFQFLSPRARPLPSDWRPCDIGYTTIGVHVRDLDGTLERLVNAGIDPLGLPIGEPGERRACVRDPEGVLVELMEDDPRAPEHRERPREEIGAVVRSITLSVPDIDESVRTFRDVLGLAPGEALHGPEHEKLWGLEGARSRRELLWAGDIAVELVRYDDPPGKPWPDGYRISDQGLLNIAFGFRNRREFKDVVERCREAGLRANGPVLRLGAWSVVYVNDALGFSIELLHLAPWYEGRMGFRPRRAPRFAPLLGR